VDDSVQDVRTLRRCTSGNVLSHQFEYDLPKPLLNRHATSLADEGTPETTLLVDVLQKSACEAESVARGGG
jgi:hypothetical protein